MTNLHQLLLYLKRDIGLERSTKQQQQRLADLMVDLYTLSIKDSERRLDKLIESALLDYEPIQDMLPVDFADSSDWSKFFQRRGSIRVSMDSQGGPAADSGGAHSDGGNGGGPLAITAVLNGIHDMMTTVYELPDYLAKHTMVQCLYYVLCEGFNQMLGNKKYLCRSKALHIRLNVSVLEEWARRHGHVDPSYGVTGLDRLTELLQLLQCLSELTDVAVFGSTCRGLSLLNAIQVKRCVVNYRYETQEPQLPKYVAEWVTQWAQEQQDGDGIPQTINRNMQHLKDRLIDKQADQQPVGEMAGNVLLSVDSRWILPFNQQTSSPSTAIGAASFPQTPSSESMYQEIKQKAEREKKGSLVRIPSLPYKLIDRLDKKHHK